MSEKLKYCPNCLGNNVKSKYLVIDPESPLAKLKGSNLSLLYYYTMYRGFFTTFTYLDNSTCPKCKTKLIEMNLTEDEWNILNAISLEQDFVFAMDKLKQNNIIEFTTKMSEFKEIHKEWYINRHQPVESQQSQSNIPKCPICGSTNIKKISATKRILSVGTLGLAGSVVGKNQQCKDCGAKW